MLFFGGGVSHSLRKWLKTTTGLVDIFLEECNPIGSVVTVISCFRRTDGQTSSYFGALKVGGENVDLITFKFEFQKSKKNFGREGCEDTLPKKSLKPSQDL